MIGASATPGKVGHDVLKNLLTEGYNGRVYAVNPKGGDILGVQAIVSINDLSEVVDLAIIAIPAEHVADALRACGTKGIRQAVVISAGFREIHTNEGIRREEGLIAIAKEYGIQLLGPNCLGIVRPSTKMNASFAKELPPPGSIALVSQSGAMGVALMDGAAEFGLGLSAFVSIGNKAVTDESDMLTLFAQDAETRVIGFYLESIRDGRRFLSEASRIAKQKPIVLLKAGTSQHGRSAAASHTGALAGSDSAIDALCAQAGIHRARTTEEFLDLLSVLSLEPPLLSPRIAIITNAGGPGILATDAAEREHLLLPALAADTQTALQKMLPSAASVLNPIDLIGDADAERYASALRACRSDPSIDGVVILLTPQVMTPVEEIAHTIVDTMREAPLMPVSVAFMGGQSVREGKRILRQAGIPTFATPERAVHALAALQPRNTVRGTPTPDIQKNPKRIEDAAMILGDTKGLLDEETTARLFALYDLPLPRQALAQSAEEAVKIAAQIGYPVIAKVSSPQILHKTDIGGVRANLRTPEEVKEAFTEIFQNANAHLQSTEGGNAAAIRGILIQQFLPVGNEFIVGGLKDPSFGPLLMVGLGGIYTELFADTAFRIAPVAEEEAYEMLQELTSWKLLLGMRGKKQADIAALALLLTRASQMLTECPQIHELDLNPVLVSDQGCIIADAKVVLPSHEHS